MLDLRKVFGRSIRGRIMDALAFLPDKLYLQIFFFACNWKFLNLNNPKTFCDKVNWLKIHDQHPEYVALTDKIAVREHIRNVLGEEYLFPLLGKWKSFDDIDFSSLPNQFVLKCNHDSGSTKIIHDKNALTDKKISELRQFYSRRLKSDFFPSGREYTYKGIEPYIQAEMLMEDEKFPGKSIEDYKFFCFDGVPKVMFVATDRNTDCKFDFYDMDFNHLDIVNIHPNSGKEIEKPKKFDEMKEIAAKLSQGIKFVRIDLYELNGRVYFGEYTFFHGGGFRPFEPKAWDDRIASWIDLDSP